MKKIFLISAIAVFTIGVSACKKKKEKDPEYDGSTAPKSNAIIENAFEEMTNMSDQAINGTLVYYNSPKVTVVYVGKNEVPYVDKTPCNVVITLDTINSPKSITIDWGATNCDCNDGKQRRGKIITTFTGKYRDSGTVIVHTPQDYYVNDNKIEGTKTVTNMGLNSSGQPFYNVEIDGTATMTNGEVFTYQSSRVRTWVAGYTSLMDFMDDEYDITGTAEASSTNGNGYTMVVTNALRVKVGCPYVTKGTLEFTPTGKPVRIVDYGNGTCDNTFTVTVNGITFTING